MYGINLLSVAQILGTAVAQDVFFGKYGAIRTIYEEIIRNCAEKNIEMVRVMMRTLARQHERAYNDMVKILRDSFTEEELRDILPG